MNFTGTFVGGHFWWWCAFCAAPPAPEWRPPLAWCQEVLRNPYAHHGGRLQLPERGPRTKGALGKFLRFAQGHNPWASCWWNHLKASAHARAMD